MRQPATAEELEQYFSEKRFNYAEKGSEERRNNIWLDARKKFCGEDYSPVATAILREEKAYTRELLVQLVTLMEACSNEVTTFIYDYQDRRTPLTAEEFKRF